MAFQFRLETLLRHRKNLQDIAQREYAESEARVREKMNEIKNYYAKIDESRRLRSAEEEGSSFTAQSLSNFEEFIELTNIRIKNARLEVRELMDIMEQKHHVLIEKAKEKKILDKLKEKKKDEYKKYIANKENKEADEMISMRHRLAEGQNE